MSRFGARERVETRSRFGPTLGFEDAPALGQARRRRFGGGCSRELAAWRTLALVQTAAIVALIAALAVR